MTLVAVDEYPLIADATLLLMLVTKLASIKVTNHDEDTGSCIAFVDVGFAHAVFQELNTCECKVGRYELDDASDKGTQ